MSSARVCNQIPPSVTKPFRHLMGEIMKDQTFYDAHPPDISFSLPCDPCTSRPISRYLGARTYSSVRDPSDRGAVAECLAWLARRSAFCLCSAAARAPREPAALALYYHVVAHGHAPQAYRPQARRPPARPAPEQPPRVAAQGRSIWPPSLREGGCRRYRVSCAVEL